jgi:hypothetical protein
MFENAAVQADKDAVSGQTILFELCDDIRAREESPRAFKVEQFDEDTTDPAFPLTARSPPQVRHPGILRAAGRKAQPLDFVRDFLPCLTREHGQGSACVNDAIGDLPGLKSHSNQREQAQKRQNDRSARSVKDCLRSDAL